MAARFFSSLIGLLLVAQALSPVAWANSPTECIREGLSRTLRSTELHLPKITGKSDWGPRVTLPAEAETRGIASIHDLILGQYNVLNLSEMRGRAERIPTTGTFLRDPETGTLLTSLPPLAKPREQSLGVASTIKKANPDVLVLEEVESFGALSAFNEEFLAHKYKPVLINGNDSRGIDVAFLIKKDLPFDVEIQSFKNVARNNSETALFSRDLPVAEFREKGTAQGKPSFIIMGTHFKSQRGNGTDLLGENLRREQVEATVEIIQYYEQRFGQDVPIFLMGDFNRDIRAGPEFSGLWNKAGLKDAFDLAPSGKSVPAGQRVTQTYHPGGGAPAVYSQLDSISGSRTVAERSLVKEANIMPYFDESGSMKPIPKTYQERETNPSDHFMIRTVIDYAKIRTPRPQGFSPAN